MTVRGNIVDVHNREIFRGEVEVQEGRISRINRTNAAPGAGLPYILPGFIDAHVHIESSMLVPSEFARLAVVHGTVATVSDPHEIANVCGVEGVEYMIRNGKETPFKFYFGAPSCVPATTFETAGAEVSAEDVEKLMARPEIRYLSELMNFPGVLNGDAGVLRKIEAARKQGKPVDGHAPGLRGEAARKYIAGGGDGGVVISTDHECFTEEEALDKLEAGMKVIIREGSAARNFEALAPLLSRYAPMMMFCSDDKHPDSLVEGHINDLCARTAKKGIDVFDLLQAACVNPVTHYQLEVGLLREGDPADFILVRDLTGFKVEQTYIDGKLVAEKGKTLIEPVKVPLLNNFHCDPVTADDFVIPYNGEQAVPVIEALDGQLITNRLDVPPSVLFAIDEGNMLRSNVKTDILKIAVVNRYLSAPAAVGFIKNFGLDRGALASSVAHDSHNIVAVGVDDESLARAVNAIIRAQGGISCVDGEKEHLLPLPVAGLMSTADGYEVARQYAALDRAAKDLGSTLGAPFMSLSFMALLVIPHLKLSDLGLFDGDKFELIR